jgi:hypothetical protein
MMEEITIPTTDRAVLSPKEACDRLILDKPMPEQTDTEPMDFELHNHEQHTYPDTSAKNTNMPSYKLSKGDTNIGFKNKRAGRIISRSL